MTTPTIARRPYTARRQKPQYDAGSMYQELMNVQQAIPVARVRTVLVDDVVQATDDAIAVDATAGAVTITLPPANQLTYLRVTIYRQDATANNVIIAGALSLSAAIALPFKGASVELQSTGTVWLVLAFPSVTFDVTVFGAVGNGTTDASTAFQAASDAAAAIGGSVYVPRGSYLISTVVTLGSNTRLVGDGDGSVIVGGIQSFLSATSKAGITIQNVQFQTQNNRLLLTGCTSVSVLDCLFNGKRSNGELTQQGLWSAGSTDVLIDRCRFVDFRDNVYLADNSGTVSENVQVTNCFFTRTTNGTADQFTTSVYCLSVGTVLVSGCYFKNLYPGDLSGDPKGYGVYEGDGEAASVSVENCTFVSTDATKPFIGVGMFRATHGSIVDCTFLYAGAQAVDGAAQYFKVALCTFDQASVITSSSVGGPSAYRIQTFEGNQFMNVPDVPPLIVQNVGSPNLDQAQIVDNYFFNCEKGAVWLRFVTYAHLVGNEVIDCNTSNDSSDQYRGGFNFFGCTDGFVDGNTVMNVDTGSMQYAVVSGASTHTINVTASNIFRNMTTGTFLRALTAPPTTGRHDQGERWHNFALAASNPPGWYCTVSGTPGTWKAEANLAA